MLPSILISFPVIISMARGIETDPYDFSSSYFCSTCFTNNQNQNYHCCFYFFKCCGEARRGAKSTTPGPHHYPPLPTRIAYLTQDHQVAFPCIQNCNRGDASPDCCHSQEYKNGESQYETHQPAFPCIQNCKQGGLSPPELCCDPPETKNGDEASTESYFQAAEEFDGYVEADTLVKNSTDDDEAFAEGWPMSPQESQDTEKPFHFALGANMNPSKMNSRYFDTNRKLFIPPSLASGHETYDQVASNKEGLDSGKLGWITKDLLRSEDEKK